MLEGTTELVVEGTAEVLSAISEVDVGQRDFVTVTTTGKGTRSVTVTVSRVIRDGEASLKLESATTVVSSALGENRAGVAALEGLDPAASVVAGATVVRVITL